MAVTNSATCPVCGWNDEVVWVSRVRRDGKVVAERWVCVGCRAMFGRDRHARLPVLWTILALAAMTALPAVWWRHRAAPSDTHRAA